MEHEEKSDSEIIYYFISNGLALEQRLLPKKKGGAMCCFTKIGNQIFAGLGDTIQQARRDLYNTVQHYLQSQNKPTPEG